MKVREVAGPWGIVIEMFKLSGEAGHKLITRIVNRAIQEGVMPIAWHSSIIVNCYKSKGNILERGNFRSIKLVGQAMKVTKIAIVQLIRNTVILNEIHFFFLLATVSSMPHS